MTHLAVAGNFDGLTPVKGLDKLVQNLSRIYEEEGAADCWEMIRYNVAHLETREMRQDIVGFLRKFM